MLCAHGSRGVRCAKLVKSECRDLGAGPGVEMQPFLVKGPCGSWGMECSGDVSIISEVHGRDIDVPCIYRPWTLLIQHVCQLIRGSYWGKDRRILY